MLNVPFYRQKKNYTCGPAVLRMVFSFFGEKIKEEELSKKLKANADFGTLHRDLIRVARERGFHVYINHGSNLEELQYFYRRGLPPIVHFLEPDNNEGHYAVVTSITKRHVFLNDPWNGSDFRMTREAFLRRWKHRLAGKTYTRWMMALSPEPLSVGRVFMPTRKKRS